MTDNVKLGIQFEVNVQSVRQAVASTKEIEANLLALSRSASTDATQAMVKLQAELRNFERIKFIDSVASQFANFDDAVDKSGQSLERLRSTLKAFGADTNEIKRAETTFANITKELRSAREIQARSNQTGAAALGLGGTRGLASLSEFFGGFGADVPSAIVARTGQAVSGFGGLKDFTLDLAAAGRAAAENGSKFAQLGQALVGLVPGAGALATGLGAVLGQLSPLILLLVPLIAIIKQVSDNSQQAFNANEALASGLRRYYELLNSLSTEGAIREVASQRNRLKQIDAQYAVLQRQLDTRFNDLVKQFGDPLGRLVFSREQIADLAPLTTEMKELEKEARELGASIGFISKGVNDSSFAAGDAAKAVDKYVRALDAQRAAQQQIAELLVTGTVSQFEEIQRIAELNLKFVNTQITAIEKRIAPLARLAEPSDAQLAENDALIAKLAELRAEQLSYTEVLSSLTPEVREQIRVQENVRLSIERNLQVIQALALASQQRTELAKRASLEEFDAQRRAIQSTLERIEVERELLKGITNLNAVERLRQLELEESLAEASLEAFTEETRAEIAAREALEQARVGEIKRIDETIRAIEREGQVEAELAELRRVATTTELVRKQRELETTRLAKELEIERLKRLRDTTAETKAIDERIQAITREIDEIAHKQREINDEIVIIAGARDNIQAVAEGLAAATQAAGKYADDVKRIEADSAEERAAIFKRYSDELIDIAREAAEAAEDAARDLDRSIADSVRDAERDQAAADRKARDDDQKAIRDYRRDEARRLREHLRDLEKIRKEGEDREFELIFNRDFSGLFLFRRDLNRRLNEQNDKFFSERENERIRLQQRAEDAERERQIDRREREIALRQKIEDARIGYARELQDADLARARALELARLGYEQELRDQEAQRQRVFTARQLAFAQELRQIADNTRVRLELIKREQDALGGGINNIIRLVTGGATALFGTLAQLITSFFKLPKFKADGGGVSAFSPYIVNEPGSSGREAFNGTPFPRSMGLFVPFRSGTINPGASGDRNVVIHNTFHVPNEQMAYRAAEIVMTALQEA